MKNLLYQSRKALTLSKNISFFLTHLRNGIPSCPCYHSWLPSKPRLRMAGSICGLSRLWTKHKQVVSWTSIVWITFTICEFSSKQVFVINSCAEILISASFKNTHSTSQFQIHGPTKTDGKTFQSKNMQEIWSTDFFAFLCCWQKKKSPVIPLPLFTSCKKNNTVSFWWDLRNLSAE